MNGSPGITGGTGAGGLPGSRQGLSLTMNEVSPSWPLIRYIADDPVYFARYQAYLKSFRDQVFTVQKVERLFDKYTALIAPFVVGTNGEKSGYSRLEDASAFKNALGALKQHTAARRALLDQFSEMI